MHNEWLTANIAVLMLASLQGIGAKTCKRVLSRYTKTYPEKVRHQTFDCSSLIDYCIDIHLLHDELPIKYLHDAFHKAKTIAKDCITSGIKILNCSDPSFPNCLKGNDGPALIYYRGDISLLSHSKKAAVIGTRKPTKIGKDYAYTIGKILSEEDYVVVSGLALGCDSAGHQGCLSVGGKTIAYLPGSLNKITPKANTFLADEIVKSGGCLISEYAPNTQVKKYQYITRDRLQALSADFIFCSEFEKQSGTVNTLKYANQYQVPIITDTTIAESINFAGDLLDDLKIPYQKVPLSGTAHYLKKIQKS